MKKNNLLAFVLVVVALGILVLAFSNNNFFKVGYKKNNEALIITTLFPFYSFTKNLVPENFKVELLSLGSDAHFFNPKPSDIEKLNKADVFIYSSDFLETWASKVVENLPESTLVLNVSHGVNLVAPNHEVKEEHAHHEEEEHDHHEEEEHEHHGEEEHAHLEEGRGFDPHYWLDFTLDQKVVNHLSTTIVSRYPELKDFVIRKEKQLTRELTALDDEYKVVLSSCQNNELYFVGHNSFAYLFRRYGITYLPLVKNLSSQTEVLPKEFVAFIDRISEEGVKHVFYEQYEGTHKSTKITRDLGIDLLPLNTGNLVTLKELDTVTFIDLMKQNLTELKKGLVCQ